MPDGVEVRGPLTVSTEQVLTEDALAFVAGLEREFRGWWRSVTSSSSS
jgi:hypothetical protein